MKISGNAVRPGMIIQHNNKLYKAIRTQHTKPGKGGAYLQVELKELKGNIKIYERFRSAESVERVTLVQQEFQFLYKNNSILVFMNKENFEQINIAETEIPEEQLPYLKESLEVLIEFFENTPINIILPKSVVLEVIETEATLKGQTVSSSFKPAILENKLKVMVPTHIDAGTKILVNTEDTSYMERAKK